MAYLAEWAFSRALLIRSLATQMLWNGVTSVGEPRELSFAICRQLSSLPVTRLASALRSSLGRSVKLTPPEAGVLDGGGYLAANSSISPNSAQRLLAL